MNPVADRSKDPKRMAQMNRFPTPIDHYNYGSGKPEVTGPYMGGQNSMIYRGGYTHDAGSMSIIHGGN